MSPPDLIDPGASAAVIETAGTPAFGPTILEAAQRLASVVELFGCRVPATGAIEPLVSSSELSGGDVRADRYSRFYHRYDPLADMRARLAPGHDFVGTLAADQIRASDYRRVCFDRPRFAEKICYGWRRPDDWILLTFYRRGQGGLDITRLNMLANIGLAALGQESDRRAGAPRSLESRLAGKLAAAYPQLTLREREVCARTLAGQSAREIARGLCVKPSTVLTYRQRSYQKLGVTSANALLDRLVR
jgi:DNA-binding CsgD family transcriptional regulator